MDRQAPVSDENNLTGSVALAERGGRETSGMASPGSSSVLAGFRFPREVIAVAVR
jgi:transposase, IS6 family